MPVLPRERAIRVLVDEAALVALSDGAKNEFHAGSHAFETADPCRNHDRFFDNHVLFDCTDELIADAIAGAVKGEHEVRAILQPGQGHVHEVIHRHALVDRAAFGTSPTKRRFQVPPLGPANATGMAGWADQLIVQLATLGTRALVARIVDLRLEQYQVAVASRTIA